MDTTVNKNRILLFIKIPPPVTGATLMNERVKNNTLLYKNYDVRTIQISYMKKLKDMGKIRISKFFKIVTISIKLCNELLFHKPDFVYFQISPHGFAFIRDLFYVLLIKINNVKIVYHLRGKGIKDKPKAIKKLFKWAFNDQEVICLSRLLEDDIIDVYDSKVYIVPNGIQDTYYGKMKVFNNKLKILFLSNLFYSKGLIELLDAFKILDDSGLEFEGIIVGNPGDINEEIINKYISSSKNKISYLGSKYGKEKYCVFMESDIFVFPTHNDIWGNVILEAMQFNLPVIASRDGAIPEIIDSGINGFIVDIGSSKQIAEKIAYFINHRDEVNRMGSAGRKKYLNNYTIDKFNNNILNTFDRILNKTNGELNVNK